MPRRKKNAIKPQNTSESTPSDPANLEPPATTPTNPDPSQSPSEKADSDSARAAVSVEVEPHSEPRKEGAFTRFLRRATEPEGADDPESPEPGGSQKRTYTRKSDSVQIANLVVSLVTVVIAGLKIPEDIKPNDDEINAFSGFGTSILIRHFPLKSKLSRDTLDLIGMLSIIASWYSRVAPALSEYRALARAQSQAQPSPVREGSASPIESERDPLTRQLFRRPNGPNLGTSAA